MFTRIFGKPKPETNALTTLDKLNEVYFDAGFVCSFLYLGVESLFLLLLFWPVMDFDLCCLFLCDWVDFFFFLSERGDLGYNMMVLDVNNFRYWTYFI